MPKEQFILGLVTICVALVSIVGGTAWWLNDTIHTSSNQVRADMTQAINRVDDGLTEVRVDMTQSFGEVRGDIRVLGTSVSGLEADVQGLQTDVQGLQTDVKGLQTDMKDLQTDVKDLQTDVKGKVKVNSLEDDMRNNNEYLRERKIQSVPNDASINDASISETPIPKEEPAKLRKISAENKP